MKTTIEELNGKLIATLEGEMDTAAALEAEKALLPFALSFVVTGLIWQQMYNGNGGKADEEP